MAISQIRKRTADQCPWCGTDFGGYVEAGILGASDIYRHSCGRLVYIDTTGLTGKGQLRYIGVFPFSSPQPTLINMFGFFECMNCDTRYRKHIDGHIKCNSHDITVCPWCNTKGLEIYR